MSEQGKAVLKMNKTLSGDNYNSLSTKQLWLAICCCLYVGWHLANGWVKPFLSNNPEYFWPIDIWFSAILPFILYRLSDERNLSILVRDINTVNFLKVIFWLLLGLVIGFVALIPAAFYTLPKWTESIVNFSYLSMLPSIHIDRFLFFSGKIYFALSAAVFEEWVYRYYLSEKLVEWIVPWYSRTLLISLLFAAVHWEGGGYNVIFAFIVGVIFAGVVRKYRSLWPAIAMHFIIDFGFLR